VGVRVGAAPPVSLCAGVVGAAVDAVDLWGAILEGGFAGSGRPARGRVFRFRAPPAATEALAHLGVDCVTLANNHALDFGPEALLETFEHLHAAGIRWVGAGPDIDSARAPAVLEAGGERLRIAAVSDHPADYAAEPDRPGVAFADLWRDEVPEWLRRAAGGSEPVLVAPHWGPNMTPAPVPHVRRAAGALVEAGAGLVAGHSAHVFHGVAGRVLYDLGDLVDDYRVDPVLRNDLGLLWLVDLEGGAPVRLEALPLKLEFCHTRAAHGDDAVWVVRRFIDACAELGTAAREEGGRLIVDLRRHG
jgi:hypothetical protein